MIDANRLFARRLKSEWRFQYRVWKMAVDWTVALYIVIPALLVAAYQYISWWRAMPGWGEAVPAAVWLGALYATTAFGAIRLFVEEADQLFLIRNEAWMNRLKTLGIGYSLAFRVVLSAAAVALFAPFLVRAHGMEAVRLPLLAALAAVCGTHTLLAGRLLMLRLPRWLGWLANAAAFLVLGRLFVSAAGAEAGWLWLSALTALLAASTALLAGLRLRLKGVFYRDAAYEWDRRMKFAALLMGQLVAAPKKLSRRTKPLVLRHSPKLFRRRTPDRVLAETIVKSFVRKGSQIKLYVQFTIVCTGGLAVAPSGVKWVLWVGVSFLLAYWIKRHGKEVLASPFVGLFPWSDGDRALAIRRATPLLFVPAYVPAGLALGWTAYGLWAGLLLMPAGWLLGYVLGELFNAW